jgi:hypothetical protein
MMLLREGVVVRDDIVGEDYEWNGYFVGPRQCVY